MEEICYKKNYLSEVIAKVDFATPLSQLQGSALPKEVADVIQKRYPIFEPQKEIRNEIVLKIGKVEEDEADVGGVSTNSVEFNKLVFFGENREKTITITPESIYVNLKNYKDYNDFKLDIIEPIEKIISVGNNGQIARTGLRFVNIFRGLITEYEDIAKYFAPMISSPSSALIDNQNCSRSILITEYLIDEIKVRMQTGIFNPDYPAKIKNKEFVLDLDAYIDIPHVVTDAKDFFDRLHTAIQEKFESCITADLREVLNG